MTFETSPSENYSEPQTITEVVDYRLYIITTLIKLKSMAKPNESIILYEYSTEKHIDIAVYGEDPRSDTQFI